MNVGETLISWEAVEPALEPKPSSWYVTLAILSVGSALAALINGNILFALILILAGITIALASSRGPVKHTIKIRTDGVQIGDQLYIYEQIESFAINNHKGSHALALKLKTGFVGVAIVPLEHIPFERVRDALKKSTVTEIEKLDSLSLRIADWIGIA